MTKNELFQNILQKKSFLCVGLDSDADKIPAYLKDNFDAPVFEFNRQIIDATADLCVAYKPNTAFYEMRGESGWRDLQRTIDYIRATCPDIFIIADAKRGDIGNTVAAYATAFFDRMNVDALTVAPYMGEDSVAPLLKYKNKWAVLLALTSNKTAADFQFFKNENGETLYQKVLQTSQHWGTDENIMYVVGATQAEMLADIRRTVPQHFLLVPGVGAQGGSLAEVAKYGMNATCGLLVNSSRQILYASSGSDFAAAARTEAQKLQAEMEQLLLSLK